MPPAHAASPSRTLLNKVPEVTVYFWLIKVLCTTVGETAADFLNADLGFGLTGVSVVTGILLAIVLALQMRSSAYVPGLYWATVTLVSVFGTLVTDNLTDNLGVPLELSSVVFGAALAIVFVAWYRSEGTLSIHSIVTTRRETFYWLAIFVTFALGTATGDLMAQALSLGYVVSAVIVIAVIAVDRHRVASRAAPGAVVLDHLRADPPAGRLARGPARPADRPGRTRDGLHRHQHRVPGGDPRHGDLPEPAAGSTSSTPGAAPPPTAADARTTSFEAVEQEALPGTGSSRPRSWSWSCSCSAGWATRRGSTPSPRTPAPRRRPRQHPASPPRASRSGPNAALGDLSSFRTITQDTLGLLQRGDQSGATSRVTDLETAWDQGQGRLQARDDAAWTRVDGKVDTVLKSLRASSPDPAAETTALERPARLPCGERSHAAGPFSSPSHGRRRRSRVPHVCPASAPPTPIQERSWSIS